ncbi:acetylserotonin O-methyltransferase [bacterium]|nr:acetylserotonin O-methyltransferase [bacterium]
MDYSKVTPQQITDLLWSARSAMALISGIDLEVFTHIANGKRTASQIAQAASADTRGMQYLLDALVGLGYLNKSGDQFGLEPVSAAFLVKGKEPYMGVFAEETKMNLQAWNNLTEVVKTGKPIATVNTDEGGREFFPKLVSAIFPLSFAGANAVAASLSNEERSSIKNILDVAAGSGAWSLAFARAIPDAKVTAVDYPEVTPITRDFAKRFEAADRYNYIEGNLREVDFGRKKYDLVILGHIIHSEGEEWGQKLIQRSSDALKDGGILLIAEMVPNDERTGPIMPLVFGLNMLINTESGGVYTMKEYDAWLKDAGFKKIWTVDIPGPSPVILATK